MHTQDGKKSSLLPLNERGDLAYRLLVERFEFDQSPPCLASWKVKSLDGSLRMVGAVHSEEISGCLIDGLKFHGRPIQNTKAVAEDRGGKAVDG